MKTPGTQKNEEPSALNKPKFTGTDNPRQLRVLAALLVRPRRREDVDSIAGCSNGPELVAELRRRGLEVPCTRITFLDRDGRKCNPGIYAFTNADRRKLYAWQAAQKSGGKHAI